MQRRGGRGSADLIPGLGFGIGCRQLRQFCRGVPRCCPAVGRESDSSFCAAVVHRRLAVLAAVTALGPPARCEGVERDSAGAVCWREGIERRSRRMRLLLSQASRWAGSEGCEMGVNCSGGVSSRGSRSRISGGDRRRPGKVDLLRRAFGFAQRGAHLGDALEAFRGAQPGRDPPSAAGRASTVRHRPDRRLHRT